MMKTSHNTSGQNNCHVFVEVVIMSSPAHGLSQGHFHQDTATKRRQLLGHSVHVIPSSGPALALAALRTTSAVLMPTRRSLLVTRGGSPPLSRVVGPRPPDAEQGGSELLRLLTSLPHLPSPHSLPSTQSHAGCIIPFHSSALKADIITSIYEARLLLSLNLEFATQTCYEN